MNYEVRALTDQDEPIVWEMLMYAAQEPSLQAVQAQDCLTHYAADWGRTGDMGFVACTEKQSIGAAWLRLWLNTDKGFGYVEDSIPELAMAVIPEYRGKGIGTALLMQVLKSAQIDYAAVSLNVRSNNPVVALYQRAGFVKVEGSEVINRTSGISFNMICKFNR
ncbi:MAG: GNAT family N-acetyltransferase [Cyanobacteria bacterium CRU_2_1]|nr:GNAT family N-acetyltransferase [Cyanobacteria bacterium RU_5_0]NJR59382.1 GNAT family N-acetyltransferase [Cyanobacteria bacterium CRU_2_1]